MAAKPMSHRAKLAAAQAAAPTFVVPSELLARLDALETDNAALRERLAATEARLAPVADLLEGLGADDTSTTQPGADLPPEET